MKNKGSLLATLMLIASISLFAQKNIAERKILIDMPNLSGGSISEVFQESEYIPLENTKESQINRIDEIQVTEKYYIILDNHKPRKILLFDKQGKFSKKIDVIPNQKIGADGFRELWVDQDKKEIITEIFSNKEGVYIVYFDFDGKYLRKERGPGNIDGFFYMGGNAFAGMKNYYQENAYRKAKNLDSTRYHVTLFKENKVIKQYFPIDTTIKTVGLDDVFSGNFGLDLINKSLLFVNSGSYKIFNISKDGIEEIYNILFPIKNSLPNNIMTKVYQGKRYQLAMYNPDLIFGLQDERKINNWLFFVAKHWSGGWDNILYNMQTSTALQMEKIQGDESNGYLPLISVVGVVGADKENLYTTVSSAEIFQAKEEMASKKPTYSKLLNNYFETSSRLGNPVLIRLKLKADF